jgi:hypothetical protein
MKTKLTIEDIKAVVVKEQYHVFPETTLTVCCLHLENGYTVTGESACVDPASFNKELGEKYAKEDAVEKIWQLEGYLLKHKMHLVSKH